MGTSKTSSSLNIRREHKPIVLVMGLFLCAILIGIAIGNYGYLVGVVMVLLFVGVPVIYKSIIDTQFGLGVFTWYSYFLFLIGRLLLPAKVPVGIGVEVLEIVLLCGIIVAEFKQKHFDWKYLNNGVTYVFIFYQTYNLLQIFNPNSTSLAGWIVSTRGIVFDLLIYFILVRMFINLDTIKRFTKLWVFLSLLAALYGIYQEIFGYQEFEWRDINSSPGTIFLIKNWDFLRKFSFLSDVATFGIVMAYSAVFCGILAVYTLEWRKKILLLCCAIIMLVAMSFSGTRTATVMVPAGAFMYIIMHLNNRRALGFLLISSILFLAILYGPFYGMTISRIRTAFQPSKDASMNARENNRALARPYILSHPIGGGVNTTDAEGLTLSPGHQLAGFPTDSGFLKTALTIGWVGLIIIMALYFTVIAEGVNNFYKSKDPTIRALYAGYIAVFFSLLVANYAQIAMGQKPIGLLVVSIFTLMPNMIKLDENRYTASR